jgi:hypothetical protein
MILELNMLLFAEHSQVMTPPCCSVFSGSLIPQSKVILRPMCMPTSEATASSTKAIASAGTRQAATSFLVMDHQQLTKALLKTHLTPIMFMMCYRTEVQQSSSTKAALRAHACWSLTLTTPTMVNSARNFMHGWTPLSIRELLSTYEHSSFHS